MEYVPSTKLIVFDRATYCLPTGACAPVPLIKALYRHVDSALAGSVQRIKAELTCCARLENDLKRILNALHDLPLLYDQRDLLVRDMNKVFDYRSSHSDRLASLPGGTVMTARDFACQCGHMVGNNALMALCRESMRILVGNTDTFLIRRGVTLRLVDVSTLAGIVVKVQICKKVKLINFKIH